MSVHPGQPKAQTQGGGPVVICCASADAGAIATVARDLEGDGHTVEVVAGVEADPKRLGPVIERCHGEGLYVLCRSRALTRDDVDELRDVLLARHVPFGRTLTVASTRPRELRERISASLRRVAAGRVKRMTKVPVEGRGPPKVRRATQLGIPAPAVRPPPPAKTAFDGDPPTRKRAKTKLGIPVVELAKELSSSPPAPPPPEADTKVTGVGAAPPDSFEDEAPTNTRMRAPKNAAAQAERDARRAARASLDEPATEPLAKVIVPPEVDAPRVRPTAPPPPPARTSAPTAEVPAPWGSQAEDGPAGSDAGAAPTATEDSVSAAVIKPEDLADLGPSPINPLDRFEEDEDIGDFDEVPIRSGVTKVQSLKEAGLDLGRGDTVVARERDVRSGNTVKARVVPPPDPVPSRPDISAASTPGSQPTRNPILMPVALGGAALVIGVLGAVALTAGDDDDGGDDAVAKAETTTAKNNKDAPAPTPSADRAVAPADNGPEPGSQPAAVGAARTKVGEALRSRDVQALDVLLVTTAPAGPVDFAGALAHCGGLSVAGLGQWRLPDIGELMSLSAAGMTGRGYYWSTTPADTFGDGHLVWYARRSRIVNRDKPNLVVCVRGDRGTG